MAEEENYKINFYAGADYGLDPNYGAELYPAVGMYRPSFSSFGVTTPVPNANQLQEVSNKLNTGAKVIEVSGLSPEVWESIPEQHLKEIYRLKKLAGVELTLHGPLVEPTGARQNWNESHREQAERQMWSAVERAHKLDPEGNIVVTFHSSNGIPDPVTKVINEKTGKEEIKDFYVVDETTGRFQDLQFKPDYFKSTENKYPTAEEQVEAMRNLIEKQNKDVWANQLQGVSFHASQGAIAVESVLNGRTIKDEKISEAFKKDPEGILKFYSDYLKGGEMPKIVEVGGEALGGKAKQIAKEVYTNLAHGDIYLRKAYQDLQNLFNQAYDVAKKEGHDENLAKLDAYCAEMKNKLEYIEKPEKLGEFADEIIKGVNVLNSIKPPQAFKPLADFAVDKSSDTFSNIALNAYKKFGDTAPIISVENPPAGTGLTRAEDLRDVVTKSREKLARKLMEEKHFSESSAKNVAEKLIGVTWDVGHINMIRKFGYGEKELIKQTETVAPFVKHVHLSDNFGMEHTELPMGMGNVPVKPMLEAINKYNDKVRKIIEAGNWYQHFKVSPLKETLSAFGSPVYSMKMEPYWNQAANATGGYFAGYGQMLPEQHFSIYGSGFSNMPTELGGQMSGRSRVSGAPIE